MMHLHRSGARGIVLILVILAITCEISWASKQCKTVVRDVQLKNCRLSGERAKRGLEKFDLLKYDEKKQEEPDYSKTKDAHVEPQKRSPVLFDGIASPMYNRIQPYGVGSYGQGYNMPGLYGQGYYGQGYYNPSLIGSIFNRPGYYSRLSYPYGRRYYSGYNNYPVSQFAGSKLSFGRYPRLLV